MTSAPTRTEHYVSRADGRVYYYKVGRGEPLLLLHGIGYRARDWEPVIGELAQRFTCYAVDLPGFDHSDIPPTKYSVEDFVRAIVDVLDSAGIAQTSIIGSHTGSIVALTLAAAYPYRVKRLVHDGLPYWDEEEGRKFFEAIIRPQLTDTVSYDIPVAPLMTWEEAVERRPDITRVGWQRNEEIKLKSRRWMHVSYEAVTSFNITEVGPRVKSPTLLGYGENEIIGFGAEPANKGVEGSILTVVKGCPGVVYDFMPDQFLKLTLPFLAGSNA